MILHSPKGVTIEVDPALDSIENIFCDKKGGGISLSHFSFSLHIRKRIHLAAKNNPHERFPFPLSDSNTLFLYFLEHRNGRKKVGDEVNENSEGAFCP